MDEIENKIEEVVQFHTELNPALWDGETLRPEVRLKLLQVAKAFYDFVEFKFKVTDIVIRGSNAAYNYTSYSDIDIHLISDLSGCQDMAESMFDAKKNLWNLMHDITINGVTTELYVETENLGAISNGTFSVLRNEWIDKPEKKEPKFDDVAVVRKTEAWADYIDSVLDTDPDQNKIKAILKKLRKMRQSGLEKMGEFSVENLTFKTLRALGYMDALRKTSVEIQDEELSL